MRWPGATNCSRLVKMLACPCGGRGRFRMARCDFGRDAPPLDLSVVQAYPRKVGDRSGGLVAANNASKLRACVARLVAHWQAARVLPHLEVLRFGEIPFARLPWR